MKVFDFTSHSKIRMKERGLNMNSIAWATDVFHKLGEWDYSGDKLTLDTSSDSFISLVKSTATDCRKLSFEIKNNKKNEIDEAYDFLIRKCYKLLKRFYKSIKKLEHKGKITLVLTPEDILITVYRLNKRCKKDLSFHKVSSKDF